MSGEIHRTEDSPLFRPKPTEITHKRYTHKTHGYVVTVLAVRNYRGRFGYHTVVEVEGNLMSKTAVVSWPALVFLQHFKPRGRKLRIKSRYERLREEDPGNTETRFRSRGTSGRGR